MKKRWWEGEREGGRKSKRVEGKVAGGRGEGERI